MKNHYATKYVDKGYTLLSLDGITINGYRPDIILENNDEVLFIEIVVSSDHKDSKIPENYRSKPVRFIKIHAKGRLSDPYPNKIIVNTDGEGRGRITIPLYMREALGIPRDAENFPLLVEAEPSLENCKGLTVRK